MLRNLLALGSLLLAVCCASCGRNEPPSSTTSNTNKNFAPSISPPEDHFYPPATQPESMTDRGERAMERMAEAGRRTTSEARERMDRMMGTTMPATMPTTLPNDTAVNIRDRFATTTPMDQGETAADITISAAIRRNVVTDDRLTNWDDKNCKIVTNNGVVTLRGPVSTAEARQEIEEKARATPGVTEVRNMLEIKSIEVTTQPAAANPMNSNP